MSYDKHIMRIMCTTMTTMKAIFFSQHTQMNIHHDYIIIKGNLIGYRDTEMTKGLSYASSC